MLAGALLIALALLANRLRRDPAGALPSLQVLSPSAGDTVAAGAVVVHFRTGVPIRLGAQGWSAGDLHPHALLDGRELMAAAEDIRPTAGAYRWTLPAVAPGPHTLLLTWAGPGHVTLGDTTGRTLRFHAR